MDNNVKFRETAVTAVERDSTSIRIWARETRKTATGALETVRVHGPTVLKFAQCSEAVRLEAMGYGLEVRLTRAAAIERDTKTKKSATGLEKFEAIKKLADHYATGTDAWAMASGGGGGLSADTRALIEALSTALGLPLDVIAERVRDMTTAERDSLRVDPEIKPALDAIYAERAKSTGVAGMVAKNLIEKLRARA